MQSRDPRQQLCPHPDFNTLLYRCVGKASVRWHLGGTCMLPSGVFRTQRMQRMQL